MRKLKVYGWQGWVTGAGHHGQVCMLAAAPSKAATARLIGEKRASRLFNLCETGNDEQITVALAHPNRALYRGLDDRKGPWRYFDTGEEVGDGD